MQVPRGAQTPTIGGQELSRTDTRTPSVAELPVRDAAAFAWAYFKQGLRLADLSRNYLRFRRSQLAHQLEVDEYFRFRLWRDEQGLAVVSSASELVGVVRLLRLTDFIIKPRHGTKGQLAFGLRIAPSGEMLDFSGEVVSTERLDQQLSYEYRGVTEVSFLVQGRVRPHPSMANLKLDAPLSYRVLTLVLGSGHIRILRTYLKLPAIRAITDNLAAGGIACPVDDAGVLAGVGKAPTFRPC